MAWVNTLPTPTGSSSSSTHAPARRSHISHLLGLLAGYSLPVAHPILSSTLPSFYRCHRLWMSHTALVATSSCPAALRGHRVYAYEPTPRTFHALVANLRRSNISSGRSLVAFGMQQPARCSCGTRQCRTAAALQRCCSRQCTVALQTLWVAMPRCRHRTCKARTAAT